jgi:IS4 transposase
VPNKKKGVLCDQVIRLNNYYAVKDYPEKPRRIKFDDDENSRSLVLLTNNFELQAIQIAQLYKHCWKIKLFFKWIKP